MTKISCRCPEQRIGSLLLNTGGPGEVPSESIEHLSEVSESLVDYYDLSKSRDN